MRSPWGIAERPLQFSSPVAIFAPSVEHPGPKGRPVHGPVAVLVWRPTMRLTSGLGSCEPSVDDIVQWLSSIYPPCRQRLPHQACSNQDEMWGKLAVWVSNEEGRVAGAASGRWAHQTFNVSKMLESENENENAGRRNWRCYQHPHRSTRSGCPSPSPWASAFTQSLQGT